MRCLRMLVQTFPFFIATTRMKETTGLPCGHFGRAPGRLRLGQVRQASRPGSEEEAQRELQERRRRPWPQRLVQPISLSISFRPRFWNMFPFLTDSLHTLYAKASLIVSRIILMCTKRWRHNSGGIMNFSYWYLAIINVSIMMLHSAVMAQIWNSPVHCGTVWHGMARHGMRRYGLVWYGKAWYLMVWHGVLLQRLV